MAEDRLLTMRDTAARLRLPRHRVLQLVRAGLLRPEGRRGPKRRFFFLAEEVRSLSERALKAWLAEQSGYRETQRYRHAYGGTLEIPAELRKPGPERAPAPPPAPQ